MVRQHYMTITCMGNIEVTYKENNFILEVTFERAKGNNFQTAIFSIDGTLLSNNGFSMSDLSFCYNFLVNNANCILRLYRGGTLMSKIFEIYGFSVSIWSNENGEPIHVYVSNGGITKNSPKFWLSRHGFFVPANDCSRYFKAKELNRIIEQLNCNAGTIRLFWINYHGYESYYC